MSELIFEDYIVDSLSYKKNRQFNFEEKPNVSTNFQAEVNMLNEHQAQVFLKAIIGEEKLNTPFTIQAEICGQFSYQKSSDDELEMTFEDYLSTNAIAILFPYVRSLVSDVSARSNEFPALQLPVINIAKLLQDRNLVTVNKLYENKQGD